MGQENTTDERVQEGEDNQWGDGIYTRTFCRSETQRSELLERQREPQQQNEAASTENSDFSTCTGYSDVESCSYFHGLAMIIS